MTKAKVSATQPEWSKYKVGSLEDGHGSVSMLTTVSHTTHLNSATRIIEDARITAGLVYDESKLNRDRISVVWLSPNHWYHGFIYGNVRFVFNWSDIIEGARFYWVESMRQYSPHACRILVTYNDYSDKLSEYHPAESGGPWKLNEDESTHYWNGDYCLEIMLERDLLMSESIETNIVDHHGSICSINGAGCTDMGLRETDAAASFLAWLLASSIDPIELRIRRSKLPNYWISLWRKLSEIETPYVGPITHRMLAANPLTKSVLNLYARGRKAELRVLARLFKSRNELIISSAIVLSGAFGIDRWQDLVILERLNAAFSSARKAW